MSGAVRTPDYPSITDTPLHVDSQGSERIKPYPEEFFDRLEGKGWFARSRKEQEMLEPQVHNHQLMLGENKERRKDLVQATEQRELIRQMQPDRFKIYNRVLAGLGKLMIHAGQRLQKRYPPAFSQSSEVYQ